MRTREFGNQSVWVGVWIRLIMTGFITWGVAIPVQASARSRSWIPQSISVRATQLSLGMLPADSVWNGSVGPQWDAGLANWTPASLPGAGDSIEFPATASEFTVDLNGDRTIDALNFTGATAYSLENNTLSLSSGDVLVTAASVSHEISSNVILLANGSWEIETDATLTVGGALSGTAALTKTGAGTLVLAGANTYSGDTTINGGTLQIGVIGSGGTTATTSLAASAVSIAAASISGNIINNATLRFSLSDNLTVPGVISGGGVLTKDGPGTLILTGNNTFSGVTTIDSGALQVGLGGTSGTLPGNIVNNGALSFDRSDNLSYAGVISGTGSLFKGGGGTLTLTSINTHSGGTDLLGGTLSISNDAALGLGSLQLGSNTILEITASTISNRPVNTLGTPAISVAGGATYTIDGIVDDPILSPSGLTKSGPGTLVLTNANTYDGQTTIQGGLLLANNTSGSATGTAQVNVATGGTLGGTGSIAGSIEVAAGGTVAPGESTGVLTIIARAAISGDYAYEIDGDSADRLIVGNDLDITNATLNISLLPGGATLPFYIIANYGSLTGAAFAGVNGLPAGYTVDYAFDHGGGTNNIALARPLTTYEGWADARGLTFGVNANSSADPNQDGRVNLEHFALDTDPLGDGGSEGRTRLTVVDDGGMDFLTLTFPVRLGATFSLDPSPSATVDGIIYQIRGDGDLQPPLADLAVEEVVPALAAGLPPLRDDDAIPGPDWEYRTFRIATSLDTLGKGFISIVLDEVP